MYTRKRNRDCSSDDWADLLFVYDMKEEFHLRNIQSNIQQRIKHECDDPILYKVHESLEQLEMEEYYKIELNDFAIFHWQKLVS